MTTEYYHNKEATTAHLQSVGLTFGGFLDWMYDKWSHVNLTQEGAAYPASLLRQYIRENNKL